MNPDALCRFLLSCLAINYAILLIWFCVFVFARPRMRRLHGRWFQLSDTAFDTIHYGAMAVYKIAIIFFNLTPLLALYVMSKSG